MRVLVIEDDADLRAVLSESLAEDGCSAFAVSSGRDGLEALETVAPDVIVLDLLMGDMDGWAFRRAQKQRASVASIPVVIVTGLSRVDAEGLDADAIIPKPFPLEMLTAAVRHAAMRTTAPSEHPAGW